MCVWNTPPGLCTAPYLPDRLVIEVTSMKLPGGSGTRTRMKAKANLFRTLLVLPVVVLVVVAVALFGLPRRQEEVSH